jgi:hypothetical protein
VAASEDLLRVVEAAKADTPLEKVPREEVAALALRRWRSYTRRHPKAAGTEAERIDDLAKGLRDRFEHDRELAGGPVLAEYRRVAERVADALVR